MRDINILKEQPAVSIPDDSMKVLRNTYRLLSMTLLFSALMAVGSIALNLGHGAALGLSIVALLTIFFVLPKYANDAKGIFVVFGITGLLGASLGPTLNHYLAMTNGPAIVVQSMLATGLIFFALSSYVMKTGKDFSKMRGFLVAGLITAILAMIGNLFFQSSAISLAISSIVVLLMSGFILHDTSDIVHGREDNYIRATVSMYLNLYNLFIHLLSLAGIANND